jgi:hypothetical protein
MAVVEGFMLNAREKRERVEAGDSVYFQWGNRHQRAVQMNVSDIMGDSSTKHWYRIELTPGREEDPDAYHKLWIIPGDPPEDWGTPEFDGGWYQR